MNEGSADFTKRVHDQLSEAQGTIGALLEGRRVLLSIDLDTGPNDTTDMREDLDDVRQVLSSVAYDLGMDGYDTEGTVRVAPAHWTSLAPGYSMPSIPCPACYPHHDSDCTCELCEGTGLVRVMPAYVAAVVRDGQVETNVCLVCDTPIARLSPREWVDGSNNKASERPVWHEHGPREGS